MIHHTCGPQALRLTASLAAALLVLALPSCQRQAEAPVQLMPPFALGHPVVTSDGTAVFSLICTPTDASRKDSVVLACDPVGGCREVYRTSRRLEWYALGAGGRLVFIGLKRGLGTDIVAVADDGTAQVLPPGPEPTRLGHGAAANAEIAVWDGERVHTCGLTGTGRWQWLAAPSAMHVTTMVWGAAGDLYVCELERRTRTSRVHRLDPADLHVVSTAQVKGLAPDAVALGGSTPKRLLLARSCEGPGAVWGAISVFDAGTGGVADVVTLRPGQPRLYSFASSADGSMAVCVRELAATSHEIMVVSLDTGSTTRLCAGGDLSAPFFLSGDRVGFFEESGGNVILWSIGTDGTERRAEWTSSAFLSLKP